MRSSIDLESMHRTFNFDNKNQTNTNASWRKRMRMYVIKRGKSKIVCSAHNTHIWGNKPRINLIKLALCLGDTILFRLLFCSFNWISILVCVCVVNVAFAVYSLTPNSFTVFDMHGENNTQKKLMKFIAE